MKKEHLWSWKGKINSRKQPQWFTEMIKPLTMNTLNANI